jgi:hypothetical protein
LTDNDPHWEAQQERLNLQRSSICPRCHALLAINTVTHPSLVAPTLWVCTPCARDEEVPGRAFAVKDWPVL